MMNWIKSIFKKPCIHFFKVNQMKTAINTRTQEEYDALMRYYKSQGIDYSEPEREGEKIWEIDKEQTCISVWIDGSLAYGSVAYYKSKHTPIIPYTEFAKANIVEEKMHKGSLRLFISELKKEFPETDLDYLDFAADRFIENNPDAFFNRADTLREAMLLLEEADNRIYNAPILCAKIKAFLTKHNDLTNHKDGE